jgi:5-methyltetrahydrofolate--homocysteine methyltransferase
MTSLHFSDNRWQAVWEASEQWWAGTLDRPLIQIRLTGADPGRPEPDCPFYEFHSYYDLSVSPEQIIDRMDYELSGTRFLGDAFPDFRPNFGPGVLAAFLGARLHNGAGTAWFLPETLKPISESSFAIQEDSVWLRRICDLIEAAERRWQGHVQIGITDLGGSLDILSTFRPAEHLLLDLYDHPDQVKRLLWESHDAWWQCFRLFTDLNGSRNPGFSCWTPLLSSKSYYMLQCDFCYMIGPDMFDEFVWPELLASAQKLDRAFYHMDGEGQLAHLNTLLSSPAVRGIQWVPGEGAPDLLQWPDVLKTLHTKQKLTQFFHNQVNDPFQALPCLETQLGSVNHIAYMIKAPIEEYHRAVELLHRYGIEPEPGI